MTYQSGNTILAGDYNTFVRGGVTAVNANVPSVNIVWGIGQGSRGYGQVGILPTVNTNSFVTANHWLSLIDRINDIRRHQVGEAGYTPIPRDPDIGEQIAVVSRIPQTVTDLFAERMLAARNAPDITSTSPQPYMWHTEPNGQITITATWSDNEQVRYFFNAGGKLRFTLSSSYFTSRATLRGTQWAGIINRLGTLELNSTGSLRIGGSGGSLIADNSVGYYDLESYNKTLIGVGPPQLEYGIYGAGYGSEDSMTIRVRSNGTQGTRGDKGTVITFSIDFEDLYYSNAFDMELQIIPTVTVRPPSNLVLTTAIANPTITFSSTFGYSAY